MQLLVRLLLLALLSSAILRGENSLAAARLGQRVLGESTWSRVIRIENDDRSSRYPRTLHALVFELAGILWFYTAADGTQSFSLHRNRLEAEKADFGPLLKDIDRGFRHWQEVSDEPGRDFPAAVELPNGCFIESLVALRVRVAGGLPVSRPQLLSYYFDPSARRPGHTVLLFESAEGLRIVDPSRRGVRPAFRADLGRDPLVLARSLGGPHVVSARLLPLGAGEVPTRIASAGEQPTEGLRQPDTGT